VDAAQALVELRKLSSQIEAAALLDAGGGVAAASPETEGDRLARLAAELTAAARDIGAQDEVTRVEVELAEGAVFVLAEGGSTVVARTGPEPSAGLVVYDLRTCLRSIAEQQQPEEEAKSKPKRSRRTKSASGEPAASEEAAE